jgi:predicted nucleic acid-binding protein
MAARILIDTGPLVCLFDRREEHFELCSERAKALPGRVYTCVPVITEAAYLLNRQDSRLVDLLFAACRDEVYKLLPITAEDFSPISTIRNTYHDLGLDFADAALMHLAEREKIQQVFTLDRRDFTVFRTASGDALELIP